MKSTFWSTHYYYTNFIGEKTEAEASKQLSQDHQLGRTKSQTRCQIPETMLLITALLISILIKMLCMILSLSLSLIHLTVNILHTGRILIDGREVEPYSR